MVTHAHYLIPTPQTSSQYTQSLPKPGPHPALSEYDQLAHRYQIQTHYHSHPISPPTSHSTTPHHTTPHASTPSSCTFPSIPIPISSFHILFFNFPPFPPFTSQKPHRFLPYPHPHLGWAGRDGLLPSWGLSSYISIVQCLAALRTSARYRALPALPYTCFIATTEPATKTLLPRASRLHPLPSHPPPRLFHVDLAVLHVHHLVLFVRLHRLRRLPVHLPLLLLVRLLLVVVVPHVQPQLLQRIAPALQRDRR